MIINENFKRSLNAFTTDMLQSFRKTFMVVFIITAALPLLNFVALISEKISRPGSIISLSGGILRTGFIIMLITLSIAFFVSTSNSEIFTQFVWPVNRKVYAVGNFLVMLACTFIFVSGLSVLLLVEVIPVQVLKLVFEDFTLINSITFQNYLAGFWVSFCHIMLAASFSYCLGMYFFRRKIITAALLILLAYISNIPMLRWIYSVIYSFIFGEQSSVILFSLKIWLLILLLHLLSYIPLKRMEVRV